MGACCFRKQSTRPTGPTLRTIRVVHLDGFVEDYESPTTVKQVIGIFPKYFMTSPIQIMQFGLSPLKLDTQLEPGKIYFLLPYATLRFNESSDNLICLTKKLISIAKSRQSIAKPAVIPASPLERGSRPALASKDTNIATTQKPMGRPPRSPSPQLKGGKKISLTKKLSNISKSQGQQDKGSTQISDGSSNGDNNDNNIRAARKAFSWRPRLSMIREISFNRRSESDLQRSESDLRD